MNPDDATAIHAEDGRLQVPDRPHTTNVNATAVLRTDHHLNDICSAVVTSVDGWGSGGVDKLMIQSGQRGRFTR